MSKIFDKKKPPVFAGAAEKAKDNSEDNFEDKVKADSEDKCAEKKATLGAESTDADKNTPDLRAAGGAKGAAADIPIPKKAAAGNGTGKALTKDSTTAVKKGKNRGVAAVINEGNGNDFTDTKDGENASGITGGAKIKDCIQSVDKPLTVAKDKEKGSDFTDTKDGENASGIAGGAEIKDCIQSVDKPLIALYDSENESDFIEIKDGENASGTQGGEQGGDGENGVKTAGAVKKRSVLNIIVNSILFFVIGFLVFLIVFMNIFILCPVQQDSMYPTIRDNQRVLLIKTKKVQNGDIFVFKSREIDPLTGSTKNLIKRVIASGGDKLLFMTTAEQPEGPDTRVVSVYRDSGGGFKLLNESDYINEPMLFRPTAKSDYYNVYKNPYGELNFDELDDSVFDELSDYIFEVPEGGFFAMGDNRNVSSDSRSEKIGIVKKEDVVGKLTVKLKEGSFVERLLKILYRDNGAAD